jgi:hypothetical protein
MNYVKQEVFLFSPRCFRAWYLTLINILTFSPPSSTRMLDRPSVYTMEGILEAGPDLNRNHAGYSGDRSAVAATALAHHKHSLHVPSKQ